MDKLVELLGYGPSFIYAAAAYSLFYWLDENLSDAAKSALAGTMKLKEFSNREIASALVEIFDRLYTRPLLRWRAFFRSTLFTLVVTAIFIFEMRHAVSVGATDVAHQFPIALGVATNVLSDYVSLFVIRSWLIRSGDRPVVGLLIGAAIGVAVVYFGLYLRSAATGAGLAIIGRPIGPPSIATQAFIYALRLGIVFALPAIVVFAWLPLLAVGILTLRALKPLVWLVGKAQWALKDGRDHPLKAVGYVAATVVFAVAATWQAVFKA